MTRIQRLTGFLVVLALQFAAVPTLVAQKTEHDATEGVQLKWHTSLDEAAVESKRTGKPILMEIHGRPWCPPCVAQGEKIIDHPDFIGWVHDKFVLLELQVGKGYSRTKGSPIWFEQFKKHKLPGIPAAVLLDEDLQAMGTVFPKEDASQWLGAASNILTTHALRKQRAGNEPKRIVPFRMTSANNISVPATLDGRIALNMMFHTAADSVSVTKKTASSYPEISFGGRVESETWGGKSEVRYGQASFAIGSLAAQQTTLFEDVNTGHDTDGKFGPQQLQSSIIQLDFAASEIRLLSDVPAEIKSEQAGWKKLNLRRESGMMFVSGELFSKQQDASADFMIHSGFSGFGLLSGELASNHPFLTELPVIDKRSIVDAAGNKLATKRVHIPSFQINGETMQQVPFSFFDGATAKQQYNVLGCDFLRRFNWCFDFNEECAYLKKNAHFDAEYFSP